MSEIRYTRRKGKERRTSHLLKPGWDLGVALSQDLDQRPRLLGVVVREEPSKCKREARQYFRREKERIMDDVRVGRSLLAGSSRSPDPVDVVLAVV